jgi:hypothetical protein
VVFSCFRLARRLRLSLCESASRPDSPPPGCLPRAATRRVTPRPARRPGTSEPARLSVRLTGRDRRPPKRARASASIGDHVSGPPVRGLFLIRPRPGVLGSWSSANSDGLGGTYPLLHSRNGRQARAPEGSSLSLSRGAGGTFGIALGPRPSLCSRELDYASFTCRGPSRRVSSVLLVKWPGGAGTPRARHERSQLPCRTNHMARAGEGS